MAMLRVSSYRKLFEDEPWGRRGGYGTMCGDQYRSSARRATADECHCGGFDFVAARALNKEGLSRFSQDRTSIAALNDRLARLIETARCFEEENVSLERQIMELEDRLARQQAPVDTTVAVPDYRLDAVVEMLRRERDGILCNTQDLRRELECLMQAYEKAVQQRTFVQLQRQDIAADVDTVTAECLALTEQVAIYEDQLHDMEARHVMALEGLSEPIERTAGAPAAIEFSSPAIAPARDIKEFYCQLAESLQYNCECVSSTTVVPYGEIKPVEGSRGSKVKDSLEITDVVKLKELAAELEKELAELNKCNLELQDDMELRSVAYPEEIAQLQCTMEEVRQRQADLQAQVKEQCEDYKHLLDEKLARDIEIAAYRGMMEEEDHRLCHL